MIWIITSLALLTTSCSVKKEILPLEGRMPVLEEVEQTVAEQKLPTQPSMPVAQRESSFSGQVKSRNYSYKGDYQTATHFDHQGDNVVVINGVLHLYNNQKIERYDIANKTKLEPLDLAFESPATHVFLISDFSGALCVVTDHGEIRVIQNNAVVFKENLNVIVQKLPLLEGQNLYIQTSDNKIIAFNISTKEQWDYQHATEQKFLGYIQDHISTLGTWKNYIIAGFLQGDVVVMDKTTREIYWVIPDENTDQQRNITTTPIVEDHYLYVMKHTGGFYKFDLKERLPVWYVDSVKSYITPFIMDRYAFVLQDDQLVAMDKNDGTVYYRKNRFNNAAAMSMFNQKLYVADRDGVCVIDPQTGDIEQTIQIPQDKSIPKLMTGVADQILLVKGNKVILIG